MQTEELPRGGKLNLQARVSTFAYYNAGDIPYEGVAVMNGVKHDINVDAPVPSLLGIKWG
jgi:hypothetical protein